MLAPLTWTTGATAGVRAAPALSRKLAMATVGAATIAPESSSAVMSGQVTSMGGPQRLVRS